MISRSIVNYNGMVSHGDGGEEVYEAPVSVQLLKTKSSLHNHYAIGEQNNRNIYPQYGIKEEFERRNNSEYS